MFAGWEHTIRKQQVIASFALESHMWMMSRLTIKQEIASSLRWFRHLHLVREQVYAPSALLNQQAPLLETTIYIVILALSSE
jgi:hypothetical protein